MSSSAKQQLWTDYPVVELGDTPGREAPIRPVAILSYDGNKYCRVLVEGVEIEIKAGYIYKQPGRCGDVQNVMRHELLRFNSP